MRADCVRRRQRRRGARRVGGPQLGQGIKLQAHRGDKALEGTSDVEDAAYEVLNGSLSDVRVG